MHFKSNYDYLQSCMINYLVLQVLKCIIHGYNVLLFLSPYTLFSIMKRFFRYIMQVVKKRQNVDKILYVFVAEFWFLIIGKWSVIIRCWNWQFLKRIWIKRTKSIKTYNYATNHFQIKYLCHFMIMLIDNYKNL